LLYNQKSIKQIPELLMKKLLLFSIIIVLTLICGCSSSEKSKVIDDPIIYAEQKTIISENEPAEPALDVRYNEIRLKASHNSYQRSESIIDQLVYHRLRAIEYDLHANFGDPVVKLGAAPDGDWLVYHHIADPITNFKYFSDALSQLKGFHEILPEHEVITVFFDITFDEKHTPARFDELISSYIPKEWIFTPADLMQRCPGAKSLKEAVDSCGWPYLEELTGKFIFVPTEASYAGENRSNALDMLCFVTGGFSDDNAIFFNMEYKKNDPEPTKVFEAGYVSRVYYADSAEKFADAKNQKANFIAINSMNSIEYPWSNTFNSTGYPFECIDGHELIPDDYAEKAALIGIESDSEGLGISKKDSFTFLYEQASTDDASISALISVPDSFSHSGANAFIMARESLSASSPYFAVVRPASFLPLSVLIRKSQGRLPELIPGLDLAPDGIPWHDVPFVKLAVLNNCKTFIAYGSFDGQNWKEMARHTFASPLNFQGIGSSSDISGSFKALFAGTRKSSARGVKNYTIADFTRQDIGSVKSSRVFDGVFAR